MNNQAAFWDSSALAPICVPEASSVFARQQLRRYSPVVWWGTSVELYNAICRLHRTKEITEKERKSAAARLTFLKSGWTEILPADDVRGLAEQLLESHELGAADSFQLAAALVWCRERPAKRSFLCGDERLCRAARIEGFMVIELPKAR